MNLSTFYKAKVENKDHKWYCFSRGFKKTIKVILSNGSSFECTEDHNLLTKDGRWVEAKDSLGLTLSKFFTTKSVKYRTINSFQMDTQDNTECYGNFEWTKTRGL